MIICLFIDGSYFYDDVKNELLMFIFCIFLVINLWFIYIWFWVVLDRVFNFDFIIVSIFIIAGIIVIIRIVSLGDMVYNVNI